MSHWKGKYGIEQKEMEREEHVQMVADSNEESLIKKHIDCPWYHGVQDGIGRCEFNKMRPCERELGKDCEEYQRVLEGR